MAVDPLQETYSKKNKLMSFFSGLGGLTPQQKQARAKKRKAKNVTSFGGNPNLAAPPALATAAGANSIGVGPATANASGVMEPAMAVPHAPSTVKGESDSIVTRTTGGAGRDMRTTVSIGGDSISYDGGPRKLKGGSGGGIMATGGGRSARRPGGRRMKAGEVLMAPAAEQQAGGEQRGLISREEAKEMGIGVNQWRELNSQILRNQGNVAEQAVANQGAAGVANIRSKSDLEELFAQQDSPQAKAEIATMLEDLKLAPLRTRLMEQQSNILKRDLAGGSKKKRSESRDITDEIVNERTNLGFMRP